ncbi:hypothetical protein oki423_03980 [Helicobacter pylori]
MGLFLNASDFKSMDNKQLLEQAGKVAPSEVPKFRAEVNKRLKAMKSTSLSFLKNEITSNP